MSLGVLYQLLKYVGGHCYFSQGFSLKVLFSIRLLASNYILFVTTMQVKKTIVALSAASLAAAQRPADMPICDYYTTALLKENTAENQLKLLTVLVNTVVIGNCQ